MRTIFILLIISIASRATLAQQHPNDPVQADTLVLKLGSYEPDNQDLHISIEAWVYSDNSILTFSSGFSWDNIDLVLDSAKPASLLKDNNLTLFLYYNDSYVESNNNKIITLGGFSTGDPIESYSQSRRLWATYYFSIKDWNPSDSITIDILSSETIEYSFVTDDFYTPAAYTPLFSGALTITGVPTDIVEFDPDLPIGFELKQNYPNPFNPSTTIEFALSQKSHTSLEIFNIEGKKVRTLVNQVLSAGTYRYEWNSNFSDGLKAPTGIYFYKLKSGESEKSIKMILMK